MLNGGPAAWNRLYAAAKRPALHCKQCASASVALVAPFVPASTPLHALAMHAPDPVLLEYFPVGHITHDMLLAADAYWPAGQAWHGAMLSYAVAPALAALNCPALQPAPAHASAPAWSEYLPTGHALH